MNSYHKTSFVREQVQGQVGNKSVEIKTDVKLIKIRLNKNRFHMDAFSETKSYLS